MTSELGSYARYTITDRAPDVVRQVLKDNAYPPEIVQAVQALREELISGPLRPLTERAADTDAWNQERAAWQGRTWLEVGWYFAESYFYRRLLEAVRYFHPGPWQGHDPFAVQKDRLARAAVGRLAPVCSQLADLDPASACELLLHSALWGNRVDLSNVLAAGQARAGLATRAERRNILIDHTDQVREILSSGLQRVDFINDNVGLDLLFDLALADFLLGHGWARRAIFHLKDRPFFVSDAMPKDVRATVSLLRASPDPAARELGARLDTHLETGRLTLTDDPFWASSLAYRRLTPALRAELALADLVILKGDVNYRRLLDDRRWPHTIPLEQAAATFPAPFLTLRTLKGEIMVGLEPGQAQALAAEDPDWLINGQRGVIHLVMNTTQKSNAD